MPDLFELPSDIFRLRVLLRPKQTSNIAPHQAAMFYAMLCDANERIPNGTRAMPDGVVLDAPDQAIVSVSPEWPISLGLTVFAPRDSSPTTKLNGIIEGLRSIGRDPPRSQSLGRFSLDRIDDLMAQRPIQVAAQAKGLTREILDQQLLALQGREFLTLRFYMPLRCSRPENDRTKGHAFLDEHFFPGALFLKRLYRRLSELGWNFSPADYRTIAYSDRNELVWLDIGYGTEYRKTLGGTVGTIELHGLSPMDLTLLILGQYVRVGENTRFGFGAYEIVELGDLSPRCPRTGPLLERCIARARIDEISESMELESGVLSSALDRLKHGRYDPDPAFRVEISKPSGGTRTLTIPTRRDRAVARIVLDGITKAMDTFMESSSMAHSRGLGRDQAARELRKWFRLGYQWAVRADFENFFDTLDHALLRRRLHAYLPDRSILDYLMLSVTSALGSQTRGVPTGSPISPLLANLFLDHFDEMIQERGGKLIRYSDDFMILCKDRAQAERLFEEAARQAESLRLRLNEQKSSTVHLPNGFEFLGFQFRSESQWETTSHVGPQLVEDLGWHHARPRSDQKSRLQLPGEGDFSNDRRGQSLILGISVNRVSVQGQKLLIEQASEANVHRIAIEQLREITVIGDACIDWNAIKAMSQNAVTLRTLDSAMRSVVNISGEIPIPDAKAVIAQVGLSHDDKHRLDVARWLIASKINNYAVLGAATWKHSEGRVREMYELAESAMKATDSESLLGYEGRAAAIWYSRFGELIPSGFEFQQRVAPEASDPINVLLNWGQTVLHRWVTHCIGHAGMVPTLAALHRERPGHSTLASDLQEPFRHLVDRAVVESMSVLARNDFERDTEGPFPLSIKPRARVRFVEILHRVLAISVTGYGQSEPSGYLHQVRSLVRQYRRSLLDRSVECRSFWHPSPIAQVCWKEVEKPK